MGDRKETRIWYGREIKWHPCNGESIDFFTSLGWNIIAEYFTHEQVVMDLLIKCATCFVYVMLLRGVAHFFGWDYIYERTIQDNISLACACGLFWDTVFK